MPSAAESSAIQTLLTSVTQALPTNGAQPMVSSSPTALPTTPASALQVVQNQLLPVINPNAYYPPVPAPWYKKPTNIAAIAVGVVGLVAMVAIARRKKRK